MDEKERMALAVIWWQTNGESCARLRIPGGERWGLIVANGQRFYAGSWLEAVELAQKEMCQGREMVAS
jgi:hypothetical protein